MYFCAFFSLFDACQNLVNILQQGYSLYSFAARTVGAAKWQVPYGITWAVGPTHTKVGLVRFHTPGDETDERQWTWLRLGVQSLLSTLYSLLLWRLSTAQCWFRLKRILQDSQAVCYRSCRGHGCLLSACLQGAKLFIRHVRLLDAVALCYSLHQSARNFTYVHGRNISVS